MRDLLRTRKQFVRERSGHVQRIQKTLEDANIKLDSVITDIVGLSGRRMIEALIAGQTDPQARRHWLTGAPCQQGRTAGGVARTGEGASSFYAATAHEHLEALDAASPGSIRR